MFTVEVEGDNLNKEIFSVKELSADLRDELVLYAAEVYRDETKEGFPKDPIIRVDGQFNKKISEVKAFGKVEFFNTKIDLLEDILKGYDLILRQSPSGRKNRSDRFSSIKYKNYNYVYYNNKLVARNSDQLKSWLLRIEDLGLKRGDVITFVNVVPYARKLERMGVKSGTVRGASNRKRQRGRRGKSRAGNIVQKPNGAYHAAQRSMSRLMKGRAFVPAVKFEPFNISIGGMRSSYVKDGRAYLYPVIKVYPIVGKVGEKGSIVQ